MSANRPQSYRFYRAAHWKQCVLSRFDAYEDALQPMQRPGVHAVKTAIDGRISALAIDPHGDPVWRIGAGERRRMQRLGPLGDAGPALGIDSILASSPRWVADRTRIWAFAPRLGTICRYEADTAERELSIELGSAASGVNHSHPRQIFDIASDGRAGLWAVVASGKARRALVSIDCRGCVAGPLPLPDAAADAAQLAAVARGEALVLLAGDGKSLVVIDAATRKPRKVVPIAPNSVWRAARIASDGQNRIALWGLSRTDPALGRGLFLFDRDLDLIEGPITGLFDPPVRVSDLAIDRAAVWFATANGLWRLDSSDSSGARESESELLTPVLDSPPGAAGRGWLRAEITIALPRGAALEARFASTDDEKLAKTVRAIEGDTVLASRQKQEAVWRLSEVSPNRCFRFQGTGGQASFAIPLFDSRDRWLWLGLKIVSPPGVDPPALTEISVLYPDLSIARHLPPIFFGDNDSDGFMRRLVGVLETTTQGLDSKIRSIGAQLDPATAPEGWVDYLARWLAIPWDDALPIKAKRVLLQTAGELIAARGTRKGLLLLVEGLFGAGSATVADMTVDHAPARLNVDGGVVLPVLLAGASLRAATLGAKAVLGRARLKSAAGDCNPLASIVPLVRIEIATDAAARAAVEPLLDRLLEQYLPAGVASAIRWREARIVGKGAADAILLLEAEGPGVLGADSFIGRTRLSGRTIERIGESGVDLGFTLG